MLSCELVRRGSFFVLSAQTCSSRPSHANTIWPFQVFESFSLFRCAAGHSRETLFVQGQIWCLGFLKQKFKVFNNAAKCFLDTFMCCFFCDKDIHSCLMFWLRSSLTVRIIHWINRCWSVTIEPAAQRLKNRQEDVEQCWSNSGRTSCTSCSVINNLKCLQACCLWR